MNKLQCRLTLGCGYLNTSLVNSTFFFGYHNIFLRLRQHFRRIHEHPAPKNFRWRSKRARLLRSDSHLLRSSIEEKIFSSRHTLNFQLNHLTKLLIIMNFSLMKLASFEDDQISVDLKDLTTRVNKHSKNQEYAVVLLRIKKSKLRITRKTWLICDRDRKFDDFEDQHRRHAVTRCDYS
jgi:hypothetical protein